MKRSLKDIFIMVILQLFCCISISAVYGTERVSLHDKCNLAMRMEGAVVDELAFKKESLNVKGMDLSSSQEWRKVCDKAKKTGTIAQMLLAESVSSMFKAESFFIYCLTQDMPADVAKGLEILIDRLKRPLSEKKFKELAVSNFDEERVSTILCCYRKEYIK